jgi:2-oxoglutarate dehydrogenase E1 component
VKTYNSAAAEPFLNGSSTAYVEEMYNAWLRDPASVHASWDAYFRSNSYSSPPTLAPPTKNHIPASQFSGSSLPSVGGAAGGLALGGRVDDKLIDDHLAVQAIIRSYQVFSDKLKLSFSECHKGICTSTKYQQVHTYFFLARCEMRAHKI